MITRSRARALAKRAMKKYGRPRGGQSGRIALAILDRIVRAESDGSTVNDQYAFMVARSVVCDMHRRDRAADNASAAAAKAAAEAEKRAQLLEELSARTAALTLELESARCSETRLSSLGLAFRKVAQRLTGNGSFGEATPVALRSTEERRLYWTLEKRRERGLDALLSGVGEVPPLEGDLANFIREHRSGKSS